MIKNERGSFAYLLVLGIIFIALILHETTLTMQLLDAKNAIQNQIFDSRNQLLSQLEELIESELTIRNSRFDINTKLSECLTGVPQPCDETIFYDMVLYPPTPPFIYEGGGWPAAPNNFLPVAGGLNSNKVLYDRYGTRCKVVNLSDPNMTCPVQAIIRFKPLCGGTNDVPDFSVPGGALCPGPAKGIEIYIGIGVVFNNMFSYKFNTSASGGDTRVYRYNSKIFLN